MNRFILINLNTLRIKFKFYRLENLLIAIDDIYKIYEDQKSIDAYLSNTNENVVEKYRFLSDYENLINYINFFLINPDFIESNDNLQKFQRLKVISINRYYKYVSNLINKFFNSDYEGIENNEEFFGLIMNFKPLIVKKKDYFFPKNYEKLKNLQIFFEEKAKNCPDLKISCEKIKFNFIEQRCNFMKFYYDKLFEDMKLNYKINKDTKKYYLCIFEVFKFSICEIFYYMELFQTRIIDNSFILQNHISYLYENLYSTLRPLIVNFHSIDELIILFNCISNYFSIFFIEENIINDNSQQNKLDFEKEQNLYIDRVYNILNSLKNEEVNIFKIPSLDDDNLNCDIIDNNKYKEFNTNDDANNKNNLEKLENKIEKNLDFDIFKKNFEKINDLIHIAKISIRPYLIKIVQDIQEKIFLKISNHLKKNLQEIDQDLQNILKYEEVINSSYDNFPLFHFFLRKLSVLLELLRNIVSKSVLNQIANLAIENFIQILNEEILNKKNLSYGFEFYIIQQLILAIKLLNEFEVESVESDIEIDIFSITDIFKTNFNKIFYENNLSIKDMLVSSVPKIYDGIKDYKKILFNNLLRSYKILINIVNNFIFGKENIDLILKIRNNEFIQDNTFEEIICRNHDMISDIYMKFDSILIEIKIQVFIVDQNIAEKLAGMIMDNMYNILKVLKNELIKKLHYQNSLNILENEKKKKFFRNS